LLRPEMDARTRRLTASTVEGLERLVGGDAITEGLVLRFIAARYGARSLFYLPRRVAEQVLRRPTDFIRAAKQYSQPELDL